MKENSTQKGFVKIIILIVIILIVLGWYGFNVQEVVESEGVQTNFDYVWGWLVTVWQNYLATPAIWVWDNVIIQYIWLPFKGMIDNGIPTLTDTNVGN